MLSGNRVDAVVFANTTQDLITSRKIIVLASAMAVAPLIADKSICKSSCAAFREDPYLAVPDVRSL